MMQQKNYFQFSPGGENEGGKNSSMNDKKESTDKSSENKEEHPTLIKKIKKALQEWAEKDQQDLDFDDTRV